MPRAVTSIISVLTLTVGCHPTTLVIQLRERERERERPPAAPRRDGTFYRGGAGVQGTTVSPSKRGGGTCARLCAPQFAHPSPARPPPPQHPPSLVRLDFTASLRRCPFNPPWRGCPHRGRPGARRGETEAPRRTGRPADAGMARVPRATTGGTRPESRVPHTANQRMFSSKSKSF